MSAKRKEKRAKERIKLKAARRAAAQPVPLPSEDRKRHKAAKKQPTVKKYDQRDAVEIPPRDPPPLDQLEQIAAQEKPEVAGAWYIALQATHHIIECAAKRDVHTGESLPRPLHEVLKAVSDATKTGTRPIPNDRLHRAAVLAFEPLRSILDHPRTRLLREYEQRPIHSIREMDSHCMAWLARLPGRTIREKLAGKQHALSVVRRFTPDTPENRVAKRVTDILVQRLDGRFAHSDAYDEDGTCDAKQRDTLDFCRRVLRDSEFSTVPASDMPRPNNALLGDRLYSRVWRAWMLLCGEEDALKAVWPHAEECFRTAAFWTIAGQIAERYDAHIVEELAVPNVETTDSYKCSIQNNASTDITKIELLVMADDTPQSGPEVSVISVEQVQEGIRIVEDRLRAQKNPSGPIKGCVKRIRDDSDKRFGFIISDSGEEYYFNPRTVGDDDTFSSLCEGDSVTFIAGSQGRGKNVTARNVRPYETGLRVAHVIEKNSKTWRVEFDDSGSGRPDLRRFRGFPVHVSPDNGKRAATKRLTEFSDLKDIATTSWRGWADIEGLRDMANTVTPSLNLKVPPASDTPAEKTAIGIDPFGRCVFVGTKGQVWSTATLPYALHDQSQWQVGTSRRLPRVGTSWALHPLDADLDDADESTAISSYHQIARALAQEVQAREMSFVVPDGLDEFSQRTLRAAMLGAFPRSRPVARSVAAALAWQYQSEFSKQGVKDGDAVLVLYAETDALRFSLLVARQNRRLAEERPESGGIFWERRPAIAADEYGESLGLRDIWRDYADRLFNERDRTELSKNRNDRYREDLLSYLVDSGLLRETGESGSPRWIRDRDRWLVLEHAPQHWEEVLGHWKRRLDSALRYGLRELILKAVSDQSRCYLLLVGPPFDDRNVFNYVKNAFSPKGYVKSIIDNGSKPFGFIRGENGEEYFFNPRTVGDDDTFSSLRKGDSVTFTLERDGKGKRLSAQNVQKTLTSLEHVGYLASEKGELAAGASEFTERSLAGLPAWKDWLPDLFLEIIRNKLYDEVKLMDEKIVDTTLGKVDQKRVAEELVLPAGYSHYTLPIVTGRANHRPVSSDLRLDSASFPLQHDVQVQLELSYQYGVENGYELKVIPVEPETAPFSELKGKWVRADRGENRPEMNLMPPFQPPVSLDGDLDKELKSYFPHCREEIRAYVSDSLGSAPYKSKIKQELGVDELDSIQEYYANAAGILHRIEPDKHWLDLLWKNVIKRIEPYENPQLYGGSIYEIARTAWILPDFLENFAKRNPDFVQKSLHVIERGVRNVVSKAAQALDPDSETEIYVGHLRGFQSYCELALALLRLGDTQLGAPLAAGSPRMSRLAKSIRRADCLLTRAGKEVRTSLDLELDKPEPLARVSDLAYAANYYLLGDATMNLARIDSVSYDE